MSSRWLGFRYGVYIRERFNPVLMGIISLVFSLGSLTVWGWHNLLVTASAMFLYLLQLRITDEFKDARHDRKFYPQRPVPRGLVSLPELKGLLLLIILLEVMLVWKQGSYLWFLVLETYAVVMSYEFGAKKWMEKHFSSNILLHEISVVPLFIYLFSFSQKILLSSGILLTAVFLGLNFFLLEIGRKVRPKKELVGDDTYLERYGYKGTILLSIVVVLVNMVIAILIFTSRFWFVCISGVFVISALVLARFPASHPIRVPGFKLILILVVLFMVLGKAYVYL